MVTQQQIYYVLNARWPTVRAYGLQVAKTCEALSRAGILVTLVIPERKLYKEHEKSDWGEIYGIDEAFPVVRLWSPDWLAPGFLGRVLFILQQTLFAIRTLLFLRKRSGVIYSRDPISLTILSGLDRPLYWEVHKLPRRLNRMHRWLLRRVRGIVVITSALAKRFTENGLPAGRIIVAPDGVDVEQFNVSVTQQQARNSLHIPQEVPIVGYVGHLRTLGEEKGIGDLLQAFFSIVKERPGTLLLIVGGTESDIAHYKSLAAHLGIPSANVRFAGHQPYTKIPLFLRSMTVVVMPFPYSEHYAFFMSPLKLFEYMASGKAIITTDLPTVREVLDESQAYFVPPGDIDSLGRAILKAVTDPVGASEKAARARKRVLEYSWDSRAGKILSFIGLQ